MVSHGTERKNYPISIQFYSISIVETNILPVGLNASQMWMWSFSLNENKAQQCTKLRVE